MATEIEMVYHRSGSEVC